MPNQNNRDVHLLPPRYISRSSAARYTGLSSSTLIRMERAGVCNPARVGDRVLYDRLALDRMMAARTRRPYRRRKAAG